MHPTSTQRSLLLIECSRALPTFAWPFLRPPAAPTRPVITPTAMGTCHTPTAYLQQRGLPWVPPPGSSAKIPKVAFGCGHTNGGTFTSHGAGLVGLGGESLSLISQLGSSIDGKFAYCLVPLHQNTASSRMDFGDSAIVTGSGAISTPLISKQGSETFFSLNLQKMSVGGKTISLPQAEKGNIIIDSGTTYSFLPTSNFRVGYDLQIKKVSFQPTDCSKH
ncbi:hypothetical protein AAC387_Pa01g3873 [Persea americana]